MPESLADRLRTIVPLLQKYAMGDFSESIEIPEQEDGLTELLVALNLMVDDIKELVQANRNVSARAAAATAQILDVIQKVASGDFSAQVEISDKKDEFDSVAMGINMMIDDLKCNFEKEKAAAEELAARNKELEMFHDLAIGRELKMGKMAKELEELRKKVT